MSVRLSLQLEAMHPLHLCHKDEDGYMWHAEYMLWAQEQGSGSLPKPPFQNRVNVLDGISTLVVPPCTHMVVA